jgi:hypothetical protein
MRREGWEESSVTEDLRRQISEYVAKIVIGDIPRIPFDGYLKFIRTGSRKESEAAYFEVRKQLTALALCFQWKTPSEAEGVYFNELLWSVSNDFSWCLTAHLSYGDQGFLNEPDKEIDLFAAETASTLSEILMLHPDIIDPYIGSHLRRRISERVLTPFLEKNWWWEASKSNWCAVCSGSVGMAALLLEGGERRKLILDKVEKAMLHYLNGFGEDGATEEGIGYWTYGFGYYIYYLAMRLELDAGYQLSDPIRKKIQKIAEFPHLVQITETSFLPFSDVSEGTLIPTGLLSYLYEEFGAKPPLCSKITSFDFDHCYRFAHISRNLWWSNVRIFNQSEVDVTHYFEDKEWLVERKGPYFFAAKGGSNQEEHNHNDVGSFILALNGEILLTDLGAGTYTADYFSDKRYQFIHTRSYWHNLPLIQDKEQIPTPNKCIIEKVSYEEDSCEITMELSGLYEMSELQSFRRRIKTNLAEARIELNDNFTASGKLSIEEGFISRTRPIKQADGVILLQGKHGRLLLHYDATCLEERVEEKVTCNHMGDNELVFRLGLRLKEKADKVTVSFTFLLEFDNN